MADLKRKLKDKLASESDMPSSMEVNSVDEGNASSEPKEEGFIKAAFRKLKEGKKRLDDKAEESRQGSIKMLAKAQELGGMAPEEALKQANTTYGLAESGGSMAGSIGDVASKGAKGLGSGIAKIFRDPEAAAPVLDRAAKVADVQNTMNMGKFLGGRGAALAGTTPQARLENLPSYAKEAVLKLMEQKGIDISKLGQ